MDLQLAQDVKGKRTKRPRAVSPFMLSMNSSSSSAGETGSTARFSTGQYSGGGHAMASSTISNELTITTQEKEEEEDMANCLILLANGQRTMKSQEPTSDVVATKGDDVNSYQCKTCNKCFNSFQALGGHRASHKKSKANTIEENQKSKALSMMLFEDQDNSHQLINKTSTFLSLHVPNLPRKNEAKSKVHECSICGAEFSSGQALGGHMRRHRSFIGSTNMSTTSTTSISGTPAETKKSRNILQLDLNLPAPEDDQQEFSFASNEQVLSFSTSPLIGCHY